MLSASGPYRCRYWARFDTLLAVESIFSSTFFHLLDRHVPLPQLLQLLLVERLLQLLLFVKREELLLLLHRRQPGFGGPRISRPPGIIFSPSTSWLSASRVFSASRRAVRVAMSSARSLRRQLPFVGEGVHGLGSVVAEVEGQVLERVCGILGLLDQNFNQVAKISLVLGGRLEGFARYFDNARAGVVPRAGDFDEL